MKKDKVFKLFSLLLVVLMMAAASLTVTSTWSGRNIIEQNDTQNQPQQADEAITTAADGVTVVHTAKISGTTTGYAGPVDLDIYLANNKITEIKALENTETPSFFKRASELLTSWDGKSPEEALEMKVDAISGATYTSVAIIDNVNVGLKYYLSATDQTAQFGDTKHSGPAPLKLWVALIVTLAACIVPLFVRNKIYRYVQLAANVVVLGFWTGQFLDYYLMLHLFNHSQSAITGVIVVCMLLAAFIYPLFGRAQHYCAYVCPLGSAQQLVGSICGYKIKMSVKTLKRLDWFRKILWAVLMLLLWADCLTNWMDLELFLAFQYKAASVGIIVVAGLFIALSAVVSRPYCRFVCPTGSLFKRAENIG